jgi:hypothetical protein
VDRISNLNNRVPDADPEQAHLEAWNQCARLEPRKSDRSNEREFFFCFAGGIWAGGRFSEIFQAGDSRTIFIEKTLGAFLIRVADRSSWMLSSS